MRTEEVIARLARDVRRVEPVPSLRRRLTRWLAVAIVPAAAAVLVQGARPDLGMRLLEPGFVMGAAAILLLGVSAASAALSLSVPNDDRSGLARALPLAAAGAWTAMLLGTLAAGGAVVAQLRGEPWHAACLYQIAGVGLVPAVWLHSDVRRAAPLEPRWTAVFAGAAAFACGAFSAAITCPIDRAAHQIWWHWLPVVVLAGLAATTARSRIRGFA